MRYIYGIFQEGELRYIGKTSKPVQHRANMHISNALRRSGDKFSDGSRRAKWIRSLLRKGITPEFQIIQEFDGTEFELNQAEKYWIAFYRNEGARLVNGTDGGDGVSGWKPSKKTREHWSKIRQGKKRPPFSLETRSRMSKSAKLRCTEEFRRAVAARQAVSMVGNKYRVGKKATHEQNLKRSRARGGRPFEDQFGNKYDTQRQAARLLGISQGDIGRVLRGKYSQIKGYVFKWVSP